MKMVFDYFAKLFVPTTKSFPLDKLGGLDKVDATLKNLVERKLVPGIAITLVKDGKTVLQNGYGFAHIEKGIHMNAERSICRIASISKCITGLALGKMVEDGILDWEDSLYDHVPYYPKKPYDFTLKQLAAHTAGMRGYQGKEFALNQAFGIRDSLKVFEHDPLVFQPGKGYLYNSFDFVLLSLAMQEAAGIPFESYVQDNVLAPLGMTHTVSPKSIKDTNTLDGGLQNAQPYTKRVNGFKKAIAVDNYYKLAGGGYLSTSADIARLGQAVLDKRLLSPATYTTLLTSQMVNGKPTYYGLGFQVSQDKQERRFFGHVGNSVGAYSNLFMYPEENMVIALLINATDPKVQDILDEIPNWMQ